MKKFLTKYGHIVAAFAIMIASVTANSTCVYIMYQEKMPEAVKKLRKF